MIPDPGTGNGSCLHHTRYSEFVSESEESDLSQAYTVESLLATGSVLLSVPITETVSAHMRICERIITVLGFESGISGIFAFQGVTEVSVECVVHSFGHIVQQVLIDILHIPVLVPDGSGYSHQPYIIEYPVTSGFELFYPIFAV